MGKLRRKELKSLLKYIKKDPRVLVPPMVGYDAGVHLLGEKYVVVSTDPCVDVPKKWFGWLLVNYAASDVALFGAKPEFCTINLLGSLGTTPETFKRIMAQVCNATEELNMAIVRGHTGTYNGISNLVGVCTAYGTAEKERILTPRNIKAGDLILCTKSVGLETIINFSINQKSLARRLFGFEATESLIGMVKKQSCVIEALKLADINGVHAMHDATEGGFVASLNELADASGLGFDIQFERFPITPEMEILQKHFGFSDIQALSTSSTGAILAAIEPKAKEEVEEALRQVGVPAIFLGRFTKIKNRILVKHGRPLSFPVVADDPYMRILWRKL
jgi:hydrogenase maturation factor